jgi:site-specific recombinase XerD
MLPRWGVSSAGERLLDKQEVSGSIPLRPTRTAKPLLSGGFFLSEEDSASVQTAPTGLYSVERTCLHMRLSEARDSWLRALKAEGASLNTLDIYSSAVDRFLDWLKANHRSTAVEKVTREDVQGFLTHLQDTRSQATAHNRYRALRALFNYVSEEGDDRRPSREPLGIIERSPMRRMQPPKLDETPLPLLSPDEVGRLWEMTERPGRDFTARRNAAIVRMFLAAGLRNGEMAALSLPDIDLGQQVVNVGGKGRKYRRVPYSGPAAIALDRYLAVRSDNRYATNSDRVWLGIKGSMTRSGVQQMVETFGARAGIRDLHPHRLRHVWVDALFSAGMTESEVMSLAGWSTPAMCRRYASARREARAIEAYRRLGIGNSNGRRRRD